jgi:tRNA (guanine-N7-)-methyltransferase
MQYTLGLHGEGHEVLYANHNVYVNEGSPEEVTAFQTFTKTIFGN